MQSKTNIVYLFLIILKICSAQLQPKIVGGQNADIRKWPFIAFIVYSAPGSSGPACGGSLLSSQAVITAAHCLDDPTNYKKDLHKFDITVLMGNANIFKTTMYRRGIDYQTNYKYQASQTSADIGILFLAKPVAFSNTVKKTVIWKPVHLPHRARLLAAGWGYWSVPVNKTHPIAEKLQVLDQYYLSPSECKKRIHELEEGTVCAASSHFNKFVYSGDSGGPLVTPEGFQVGLVSYKTDHDNVIVYTSLSYYRSWIKQTQAQLYRRYCPRKHH